MGGIKKTVEDLRWEIFGDDRNNFLIDSLMKRIAYQFKYGGAYKDPLVRQTGRTTMRVLQALHIYMYEKQYGRLIIHAHNPAMVERMKSMFMEFATKLKVNLPNDFWVVSSKFPHGDFYDGEVYHLYDHPMP